MEAVGAKEGAQMRPKWSKMKLKWSLGGPKMIPKWAKVGPRTRSESTCEKGVPQSDLGTTSARLRLDVGVHFGSHFDFKNERENGTKIRRLENCVWEACRAILGITR